MTNAQPEDLKWLAQQYVLDELDAAARESFEARLAGDEEAAAAMASAVQLVSALGATSQTSVTPAPKCDSTFSGWGLVVGVLTTAAALTCIWLFPSHRDGTQKVNRATDLVAMWSDTSSYSPFAFEADRDEEPTGSDEIPGWLLVAVAIEAGDSAGNQVLEN